MNAIDLLVNVKKRLNSREKWTQHALARMEDGTSCHPTLNEACSWCIAGACWAEDLLEDKGVSSYSGWSNGYIEAVTTLNDLVKEEKKYDKVSVFNDNATYEQVIALLDKGIERLKNVGTGN